ncbi:rRNA adenine N-6-methyltransferase [Handroanthus impetiginosus]|uniref:rRNA adenine N-6-methyltransferase n=1 Tax=Handroanthus impetiginosus TaxID=429701 RepID=A0A2G9I9R5_9LAMI|nr:rRNA adenine N-6-methyltransferase [Handroanthus impetiginosus]
MADGGGARKYSCMTASETLEWIHAIIDFLKPYWFFLDAHVVNFFKDKLWEAVDKEWMDCLRKEPVEKLLQIPSGVVQDHWPASLKEYVLTLRSLSLHRNQADLQEAFPGLRVAPLNNVLAQGMNQKKKHEIEVLAAVIGTIARRVGAYTIVDVGSGQGYLAQVLSFEHELSVIAIDASSHHGSVTNARAKRIEKHYAAKMCKSRAENKGFSVPRTVTCRVLSTAMLKDVSSSLVQMDDLENPAIFRENSDRKPLEGIHGNESPSHLKAADKSSLVLAGLHACGDLSVTMLRTFMECDEVKAVISIGCCYNLLSEEGIKEADNQCGFPVSMGAKSASVQLGKNARDLACQSAERWRGLGEAAGLHNFELHAFRAAFQMVLSQYNPEIIMRSPAIGRQGKALRRQHHRRILESNAESAESFSQKYCSTSAEAPLTNEPSYPKSSIEDSNSVDRYSMFLKFCKSGLGRLGLHDTQDIEFSRLWLETEEFSELVGPYWTLRAALGPVLETLLLLDRLLFLQEQCDVLVKAAILPLFDPVLSPRNMALIAEKD